MIGRTQRRKSWLAARRALSVPTLLGLLGLATEPAAATSRQHFATESADGVYGRFDGDLDLGLGLGAEFGSEGAVLPVIRGSAHYFSSAGLYALGRARLGAQSTPSLLGLGVDLRPLFLPRWAKGYELGPPVFDLTLDSLSLSLGAFWSAGAAPRRAARGFEAGLGFGIPLLGSAGGPWLETRGTLRYPDAGPREEAVLIALAWHGFINTPLTSSE